MRVGARCDGGKIRPIRSAASGLSCRSRRRCWPGGRLNGAFEVVERATLKRVTPTVDVNWFALSPRLLHWLRLSKDFDLHIVRYSRQLWDASAVVVEACLHYSLRSPR